MKRARRTCLQEGCTNVADDMISCRLCHGGWCSDDCATNDRAYHKQLRCGSSTLYFHSNVQNDAEKNSKRKSVQYNDPAGNLKVILDAHKEDVEWRTDCEHSQFLYLFTGIGKIQLRKPPSSTVEFDELVTVYINPGDGMVIPAGTPYRMQNDADEPMRFVIVYCNSTSK